MLKKYLYIILLGLFINSSCGTKSINEPEKGIYIIGKAENAKGAAIVTTADQETYFLSDLDHWSDEYLNKSVKITGKLETITREKTNSQEMVGEWTGTRKYIKKAKWSLAE